MLFSVHVFAWLPYNRIANLAWGRSGREAAANSAAGPYFEGDRYVVPPATLEGMRGRSVRAWQGLDIPVADWGQAPGMSGGAVYPAPLHVLQEDGATRVQTETGVATRSAARVGYNPGADAYEVDLEGEATIPFLVEAAADTPTAPTAEGLVPALGWKLHLAIGQGASAAAGADIGPGCDESTRFFAGAHGLGGKGRNRVHGHIDFRFFPSYAVYVALRRPKGGSYSAPAFFANGFGRKITGIYSWTRSPLRPLSW
jgi:hypothetical protein